MSDKLMQLARGQVCQIRLPGCLAGTETVVNCHYRSGSLGAGMALKNSSFFGAHGCHQCHRAVDGQRFIEGYTRDQIRLAHAEGVLRTQHWLLEHGHVQIGKRARESA